MTCDILISSGKNQQADKKIITDINKKHFENFVFTRLVAKDITFTEVNFNYSIFDTSYLRNCTFDSCSFIGCRFINSNLNGSKFMGCKFEYAFFEKTIITDEILNTECPGFDNLKMKFARSLRINYQQLGETESVNKAIQVELEATEIFYKKKWHSNEQYYRKKYSGLARIKSFLNWIFFKIMDFIWGNGESVLKLLRFTIYTIAALTIYNTIVYKDFNNVAEYIQSFPESIQIFLGIYKPLYINGYILSFVTLIRLIIIGFLLSIIIKKGAVLAKPNGLVRQQDVPASQSAQ